MALQSDGNKENWTSFGGGFEAVQDEDSKR